MQALRSIDPVISFRNTHGETMRGTLTSYQKSALVMEVYNPNSIVQVSEVVHELTVRSGDKTIYKGKAVVVSLVNTGLMTVVSVTLTDDWNEVAGIEADPASFAQQAAAFVDDWSDRFSIQPTYQVAISELRAYLADMARWVDQADLAPLPRDASGRLREDVFFGIAEPLILKVRQYVDRFEAVAGSIVPDQQAAHRVFAQAAIHPLILRAPFVYRTFAKPLGYAGDYEMVNQILSDPREGSSTYFQIINTFFLQAVVARAHRNRIDILDSYLARFQESPSNSDEPIHILNVGCGPAIEVQRLIATHPRPERLRFTLMDFSQETLAYTQARIREACARRGIHIEIEWVNASVHHLIKRASSGASKLGEKKFDFVYCAGLFDYLSEKVCQRLLQYFADRTKPSGTVLVTNVHTNNPEKNAMEHLLEWHLIYRDENDMRRMAPARCEVKKIYTDATGINVFLELQTLPQPSAALA